MGGVRLTRPDDRQYNKRGEAGLPTASFLDPAAVVPAHPKDRATLGSGASAQMNFWMAFLVALTANAKTRAANGIYFGWRVGDKRHDTYLCSFSRVALDPLSLSDEEEQTALLGGNTHWQEDQTRAFKATGTVCRSGGEDTVCGPGRVVPVRRGQDRRSSFMWSLKSAAFVASKAGPQEAQQQAPRIGYSGLRDAVVNVLLPDLLFALAVTGMESVEEDHGVNMGKLGMPRDQPTGRLEALGPGGAIRGPWPGVPAAFAATYTDG